jgi:hypothetical protein
MPTTTPLPDRPTLERGDRVQVTEEGITPWFGIVNSVKPSKESGWWVDVEREAVGVWSICLAGTKVTKMADSTASDEGIG